MKAIESVMVIDDCEVDIWLAKKIFELNNFCKEIISARDEIEAFSVLDNYYRQRKCLPNFNLSRSSTSFKKWIGIN
jgi:hypothetical protein